MKFTPITEKTYDFIQSSFGGNLRPISVFIPCKKHFGISLAARMLKKFWMEDLNNQPNPFKSGDIIKITIPKSINGTKKDATIKAKVVSTEQTVVKLRFSDKSIDCVTRSIYHLYQYAKVDNSGEDLSSFKLFNKLLKNLIHSDVENNPWTKFLNVDYPVPTGKLSSKVYFIAGRGNVDDTREFVERMGLKDTFSDALIVKESLKEFSDILRNDQDRLAKLNNFIKLFDEVFGPDFNPGEDVLIEYLYFIREKLGQSNVVIEELNPLLDQFIIELINYNYCDEYESLKNITGHMLPDVTLNELNISSVKSVLIDGIELATTYANTIRALHNLKIPVIVLSDYSNYTKERKEKTNNFFRDFSNSYRLNWNKAKINLLEEIATDNQYIDEEAYRICKQYHSQRVTIEASNDATNIIDKFFNAFEIRGVLRRIEGFEGIKNAYTIHLRPVVYWVKNMPGSIKITKDIIEAVNSFQENFDISRSQLNTKEPDIVNLIDDFLTLFSNVGGAIDNSKTLGNLPVHSMYFKQTFGRLVENTLPLTNCQLKNTKIQTLVFTGTPYEEVKQYYLRKAIFEDFKNVYFLGFCKEAENVYQRFINDTIRFNRGIHDILPVNYLQFWEPIVELETDVTYLNERCSLYKNETEPINEDVDFDEVQDLIELARYQVNDRDDSSDGYIEKDTKVLVNILELDGNKSVFIKKTGARKLLVLKKNKNLDKADWDDINPGDRVFTHVITRRDTLEMRGENTIDELVFKDLDIWYEKLKEMWESFNESFIALAEKLNDFKMEKNFLNSNPEPSNLRNWLHKERIINAPEKNNLMLILSAAGTSNVNDLSKKIMTAKRRVEKFDRKNRDDIKKHIEKYINKHDIEGSDEFIVIVNSVSIVVKHGVVKHKMETLNLRMEQDKIGIVIKME
jgi:hypothetical protein